MGLKTTWLALLLSLGGCGSGGENENGTLTYGFERPNNNELINTLLISANGKFKPSFMISGLGEGMITDLPLDTVLPYQERIPFSVEAFGTYSIQLTFYQENGQAYLFDKIPWTASGEVPPPPNFYLSEIASSDAYLYLVTPPTLERGINTKEVEIEGDVAAPGQYYSIPSDDQVLFALSEGDGEKKVRVRYRNIFGSHGSWQDLSVIRKSIGPQNCKATPVAEKTASGMIRIRYEADNDGPIYYKVSGQVAVQSDFKEFQSPHEEFLTLSPGQGLKKLKVKIKDQAGNACEEIALNITVDSTYVSGRVTVQDVPYWTDTELVTVLPYYDHLPTDVLEMYVAGGVRASDQTFQWIPYAESLPVQLTASNGARHILVKFRREGTELLEATVQVHLRPYVFTQTVGSLIEVHAGEIVGATSMSVTGCAQAYVKVPYQNGFPCTPSAAQVKVRWFFPNGSELERSANF